MKYRGVVYDVGLNFTGEGFSVDPFDEALVANDMRVIANELHANAVRIEGEEIHRLVTAARLAHSNGLSVFFNPWKMNTGPDVVRAYYADAAAAAEVLRGEGIDIVFVMGCEYTIFNDGVFPGANFMERGGWLGGQFSEPGHMSGEMPPALIEKAEILNTYLGSFIGPVRERFEGPVTYSAGSWELVDWSIFDIVGIDYYRRGESEADYVGGLDRFRLEKPVVVMEVGCCGYEGAAEKGDGGFALLQGVNPDGTGIFEGGVVPIRKESEQADYVGRQFELLSDAGIEGVFIFVFAWPAFPAGEGARDIDMMSFSLVRSFPAGDQRSAQMPPWERKQAFHRVAEVLQRHAALAVVAS